MHRWVIALVIPILVALAIRSIVVTTPPTYIGQRDLELQSTPVTCGPASLAFILRSHGISVAQAELAELAGSTTTGTSMLGLKRAAERYGFTVHGIGGSNGDLSEIPLPAIAVFKDHFVVITKVTPEEVEVGDPLWGFFRYSRKAFLRAWQGQVLVIER